MILLGISSFFAKFWVVIVLLVCFVFLYFKRIAKTESGRLWIDSVKIKMPIFGSLICDSEIGRFARTLGTLLGNGVVILPALKSVQLVVENEKFRHELRAVVDKVADGASLTIALQGSDILSEVAINMISVGEESGKVHEGLTKLALYYERQSQKKIKVIITLIEPVLILVMGAIVGFVVLAMLMPIFKMNLMIQ